MSNVDTGAEQYNTMFITFRLTFSLVSYRGAQPTFISRIPMELR